jgi:hypothetical protein
MVTSILFAASALVSSAPKVMYVEKLQIREVTVHEENFNSRSSTTQSQQKGSFGLDLEFDGDFSKLGPDSSVSVTCGKFSFEGKLSEDSSCKPDRKNATLRDFADRNATVKYITSIVTLKWTPTRLSMKVNGKIPDSASPVGADIPGRSEKFIGQTEITARVGTADFKSMMDFSGTFKQKDLARGNVTGSETNIEVKGKI